MVGACPERPIRQSAMMAPWLCASARGQQHPSERMLLPSPLPHAAVCSPLRPPACPPAGEKGIKLSELVENLLRMGAWGSHDPFMSSAMRADATDAKLAQVRAHDEMQQLVEARRALRMATTAKGLHTTLHKAGSGRPTGGGEAEAEPSALEAMYQSRAASAASALFSKPPDPLAGEGARPCLLSFAKSLPFARSGRLLTTRPRCPHRPPVRTTLPLLCLQARSAELSSRPRSPRAARAASARPPPRASASPPRLCTGGARALSRRSGRQTAPAALAPSARPQQWRRTSSWAAWRRRAGSGWTSRSSASRSPSRSVARPACLHRVVAFFILFFFQGNGCAGVPSCVKSLESGTASAGCALHARLCRLASHPVSCACSSRPSRHRAAPPLAALHWESSHQQPLAMASACQQATAAPSRSRDYRASSRASSWTTICARVWKTSSG